jgi:LPS-assembly protein
MLLQADHVEYYDDNNIAIASGNVSIIQNNEIINADKVIYNRNERLMDGYGNVAILEKNGNIVFADSILVRDDLSHGTIHNFSSRLKDGSLFVANDANIVKKDHYNLNKAVFTSCPVCKNRDPQWQIKSYQVEIDKENHQVKYKNAFFELYGLPVFYTPYFSHPTSDVKRKSGLLAPSYGSNSNLGHTLKTPYYISISPNKEAIIAPLFTTSAGIVLNAEFNHLTKLGSYGLGGSVAKGKIKNLKNNYKSPRHHLYGKGDFKLDSEFSAGFDFIKVSDRDYLRDYGFVDSKDFLTSSAYVKYDKKNEVASIKVIDFKRLRDDNNIDGIQESNAPTIIPYVDYHLNKSFSNNIRYDLDGNLAGLERNYGTNYNRVSITNGFSIPYTTYHGSLFKLTNSIRTDVYYVDNNKSIGRALPEARLNWRLPLINKIGGNRVFLEPIANIIWSPTIDNNRKIPNEDSTSIDLYDDNLFNSNHFAGYDRVETGPRANYGVNSSLKTKNNINFNGLFGQYYHFKKNQFYLDESGMKDRLSDYVGRLSVTPIKMVDLSYRFMLDKKTLESKRDEVDLLLRLNKVNFNIKYVMLNTIDFDKQNSSTKRQIVLGTNVFLTDRLTFNANMRRNVSIKKAHDPTKRDNSIIALAGEMVYKGDCTDVIFKIDKDFTKDAKTGKKGLLKWTINFSLKNLTN